ncbi:MarR family transcriptional regulator [Cylindrospermopsis raciborskii]|uniref:MarR family transcriptional regulator n=1 Tax=Cylindrospermopsis raciborskii CENA302 TaxID=1170768 RepID=A0A9Q5W7A1_9CYAN|nr:MarR family transcriptional regulator [Cylindrospermopsis raciborskii]MCZ2201324.1 MarR family transcriptional regulator [Cylindrospermopsis raciborskii PAMP2012]MCZ2206202.1 MarR family transcriptional regulator [Cylindrospermopsis raciborskii PAMP2011]NLQ04772.1 MarR family transcriptional regulator [Cylindrospermopsis raciborskii MVCC19]OHY33668.1 MarR family transcriptional regulator [Cylindrospermopsis raciborskii MVCC14]OPH08459.1 MarR family transcriptional regulator [Cylindrospermop
MSLDKPSRQCAARVMETIPLLMRFIRTDMRTHSADCLSIPQLRSLAFLNRNPGASLSAVADHLGVTCATASTTIERLVQRHLVQRSDHPQERRRIVLNLTMEGKSLLEESQEKTRIHIAEIIDGLTSEEILQIETGLTLLKNVFETVD